MKDTVFVTSVAFLSFAVIHSLFLTKAVKGLIAQLVGQQAMRGLYRFFYTILTVVALIISGWVIYKTPDHRLLQLPLWAEVICRTMQALGIVVFIYASRKFDLLEFVGLRQVYAFISGNWQDGNDIEGLSKKDLITDGAYRIVRHPMYLAGLLIFTFNPAITVKSLTLTVLADGYLIFGAWIESRRYVKEYGDRYRQYMAEVPMIIPDKLFPRIYNRLKGRQ